MVKKIETKIKCDCRTCKRAGPEKNCMGHLRPDRIPVVFVVD